MTLIEWQSDSASSCRENLFVRKQCTETTIDRIFVNIIWQADFKQKNLVISLATVGFIIPLLLLLSLLFSLYSHIKNKEFVGMMKDDLGGVIMEEFIGLHSKMHFFKKENNEDWEKVKWTSKCTIW